MTKETYEELQEQYDKAWFYQRDSQEAADVQQALEQLFIEEKFFENRIFEFGVSFIDCKSWSALTMLPDSFRNLE